MKYLPNSLLLVMLLAACTQNITGSDDNSYRRDIEDWRISRHERLIKPDSYLSQVGLEWLTEGENRVGSAPDNDIQLTGGPSYWGSVFLSDGRLRFEHPADNGVTINGEQVTAGALVPDIEGEPTKVEAGTLSFYAIFRGSFALRVKDSQAKALQDFEGMDNYPIDKAWRINGRFIYADEGATMEVVNVLGQVSASPVFGTIEFERDGKMHRLAALGTEDSESLWFIFADRTSGHGTYGAGRFLYSDAMPQDGRLILDFNKAYNPPCAFNDYSTCPLPPQQNRMNLMVTAGEKDYHPESG